MPKGTYIGDSDILEFNISSPSPKSWVFQNGEWRIPNSFDQFSSNLANLEINEMNSNKTCTNTQELTDRVSKHQSDLKNGQRSSMLRIVLEAERKAAQLFMLKLLEIEELLITKKARNGLDNLINLNRNHNNGRNKMLDALKNFLQEANALTTFCELYQEAFEKLLPKIKVSIREDETTGKVLIYLNQTLLKPGEDLSCLTKGLYKLVEKLTDKSKIQGTWYHLAVIRELGTKRSTWKNIRELDDELSSIDIHLLEPLEQTKSFTGKDIPGAQFFATKHATQVTGPNQKLFWKHLRNLDENDLWKHLRVVFNAPNGSEQLRCCAARYLGKIIEVSLSDNHLANTVVRYVADLADIDHQEILKINHNLLHNKPKKPEIATHIATKFNEFGKETLGGQFLSAFQEAFMIGFEHTIPD